MTNALNPLHNHSWSIGQAPSAREKKKGETLAPGLFATRAKVSPFPMEPGRTVRRGAVLTIRRRGAARRVATPLLNQSYPAGRHHPRHTGGRPQIRRARTQSGRASILLSLLY